MSKESGGLFEVNVLGGRTGLDDNLKMQGASIVMPFKTFESIFITPFDVFHSLHEKTMIDSEMFNLVAKNEPNTDSVFRAEAQSKMVPDVSTPYKEILNCIAPISLLPAMAKVQGAQAQTVGLIAQLVAEGSKESVLGMVSDGVGILTGILSLLGGKGLAEGAAKVGIASIVKVGGDEMLKTLLVALTTLFAGGTTRTKTAESASINPTLLGSERIMNYLVKPLMVMYMMSGGATKVISSEEKKQKEKQFSDTLENLNQSVALLPSYGTIQGEGTKADQTYNYEFATPNEDSNFVPASPPEIKVEIHIGEINEASDYKEFLARLEADLTQKLKSVPAGAYS